MGEEVNCKKSLLLRGLGTEGKRKGFVSRAPPQLAAETSRAMNMTAATALQGCSTTRREWLAGICVRSPFGQSI